jgi:hypothetical protein
MPGDTQDGHNDKKWTTAVNVGQWGPDEREGAGCNDGDSETVGCLLDSDMKRFGKFTVRRVLPSTYQLGDANVRKLVDC